MATPKSVAFHTLGCKLNYAETSSIGRLFEAAGYAEVDFDAGADVYVINTCSVTDFADRKCRQTVRRALRRSPHATVAVVGCYAQLKPEEIANIPGVDIVLGAAEKFRILDYVNQLAEAPGKGWVRSAEFGNLQFGSSTEGSYQSPITSHHSPLIGASEVSQANTFHSAFSFGDRTRSFLKVQDGCDYICSFCTIPMARGSSRSDTVENAVANAWKIADMGVKEIVLTGVNLGDFGNGTEVIEGTKPKKEALFIDLIKKLDEVTGIERFRISSIEPNLCTEEVIEFVAGSERFMPHFHMPLQSGNNKQLTAMRRRYRRELYAVRVEKIKALMPHCCIGVDVIVGFPGETHEDFLETCRFIEALEVSYLHVFTYSERPNTPAATLPGAVPMEERRRRNEILTLLSAKKRRYFYEKHLGNTREVLFEHSSEPGRMSGFTDNYIKIDLPLQPAYINQIASVELLDCNTAEQTVAAKLAEAFAF